MIADQTKNIFVLSILKKITSNFGATQWTGIAVLTAGLLLSACGGGASSGSSSPALPNNPSTGNDLPPIPTVAPTYLVAPPSGKLPFPQHAPNMTVTQYEQMRSSLWILNNFGMYQGSDDGRSSMYLHDGLDFMLPDGSPVYAVRTGVIRDISGDIIAVDDPAKPDTGWQMAHLVVDPRLKVGTQVWQGQYVGSILKGNSHTHFNYVQRSATGSWFRDTISLYPNHLFTLPDEQKPEFNSGLRYFKNASEVEINPSQGIYGKVDIVLAMRDLSPNHPANYVSRSAPAKFEIRVSDLQGQLKWQHQSQLQNIQLTPPFLGDANTAKIEANLLFKRPDLLETGSWTKKAYLWWVLTNLPDHAAPQKISARDEDLSWDTAAKNSQGGAVFPNGLYSVTIIASDQNGNVGQLQETVRINN